MTALLDEVAAATGVPLDVPVEVVGDTGLGGPLAVPGPRARGRRRAARRGAAADRRPDDGPAGRGARGLAVRSERFVRLDGRPLGLGFAPLSRFWRTADGWLRLHGNYPHHRAAAASVLGSDDVDAVATAAAGWRAVELESAVVAAGGAAAAVRTPEEWAASPQGRAVAGLPLLDLRRTTDGPPRRPDLRGLRVLDLTRVIAGPVADAGARLPRRRRAPGGRAAAARPARGAAGHRRRQAARGARPGRRAGPGDGGGAAVGRGRRGAGLPARGAGRVRHGSGRAGAAAPAPRRRPAVRLGDERAVGGTARLRLAGAGGDRHRDAVRHAGGAGRAAGAGAGSRHRATWPRRRCSPRWCGSGPRAAAGTASSRWRRPRTGCSPRRGTPPLPARRPTPGPGCRRSSSTDGSVTVVAPPGSPPWTTAAVLPPDAAPEWLPRAGSAS